MYTHTHIALCLYIRIYTHIYINQRRGCAEAARRAAAASGACSRGLTRAAAAGGAWS